jgi:hypothetical protein
MLREATLALTTVIVACADRVPEVTRMSVVPAATPVTTPKLFTVATDGLAELQTSDCPVMTLPP